MRREGVDIHSFGIKVGEFGVLFLVFGGFVSFFVGTTTKRCMPPCHS